MQTSDAFLPFSSALAWSTGVLLRCRAMDALQLAGVQLRAAFVLFVNEGVWLLGRSLQRLVQVFEPRFSALTLTRDIRADLKRITLAVLETEEKVKVLDGFISRSNRLLWIPNKDVEIPKGIMVHTFFPDGSLETKGELKAGQGLNALTCAPYWQRCLNPGPKYKEQLERYCVERTGSKQSAVVKMWPVTLEGFLKRVECADLQQAEALQLFSAEALESFLQVLERVLGADLYQKGEVKFVTVEEECNPYLAVVGTWTSLVQLATVRQSKLMRHYFRIQDVTDAGFQANMGRFCGDKFFAPQAQHGSANLLAALMFLWNPFLRVAASPRLERQSSAQLPHLHPEYVLYVRTGDHHHACLQTRDEFGAERVSLRALTYIDTGEERYKRLLVLEHLGGGGFGSVVKVSRGGKHKYALKLFTNVTVNQEDILQEAKRAVQLSHRNIVKTLCCIQMHRDMSLCMRIMRTPAPLHHPIGILMELADSNLEDIVVKQASPHGKALNTDWCDCCRRWMAEAAEAVFYLHVEKQVVHRDLKPSNLLLYKCQEHEGVFTVKVSDFGLLTPADKASAGQRGTKLYMAPELSSQDRLLDLRPCDVFSLALTFRAALNRKLLAPKLLDPRYDERLRNHWPEAAQWLVYEMTLQSVRSRINIQVVKEHCFFRHGHQGRENCSGNKLVRSPLEGSDLSRVLRAIGHVSGMRLP